MKKILFVLLMVLTVVLAACGGKKESKARKGFETYSR